MRGRLLFYSVVVLLALCGLLMAFLRHLQTDLPFLPGAEKPVWLVEARIDFSASGGAIKASLSLPESIPGYSLFGEQAASPGYGFSIINAGGDRRAEWTRREATGEQSLYYTAQFVAAPRERGTSAAPAAALRMPDWDAAQRLAGEDVVRRARATSSDPESFTRELIKLLSQPAPDQNTALLLADAGSRAELLMLLLDAAGIQARLAMGLELEDARRRQSLKPLVEVAVDDDWLLFNPRTGATGVPPDLLLWHRGGVSVLDVNGGSNSRVSFSMIRQSVPARQLAMARDDGSFFFDLGVHRLPIEEQSMFKLLFLLPLGALVVVFMRVMVGLRTAGTFMPILIALAFIQTSLIPGLISFVGVIAVGLALRGYLSRLNLLLVARIATLLVLVVFMISAMSIIGYEMGYSTGMTITFFPMIIMAWTIERMSILWEEEGPREVMLQGGGSLLVAVAEWALMEMPLMKHLTFNFPELNLVLLAAILAMGQYTGYKLTELRRFHAMDDS